MRRLLAASAALALAAGPAALIASPAQAEDYSGFSTSALATPLRIEMFEPAIPVPAQPEVEMNFSFTRVLGESGPASKARASAMWPGAVVGEGLPALGDTMGLPKELTQDGYPVQVNANYPSEETQVASEPFPGMIQRVDTGEKRTVAKAAYTPSGDVKEGGSADEDTPLDDILNGDPTAIGDILTGVNGGDDENPVGTNPLGALSLLVDVDGMTSVTSTENDGETVTAKATGRLGEIRLLGGLITLGGVNVVNQVSSSLEGGPEVQRTIDVGAMTIGGQKFGFGPDGFDTGGKKVALPGLPSDPVKLLETLGIKFEVPQPTVTKDGTAAKVEAEALRITIDLKPLRSQIPLLPLDDLVSQIPDLPGQANLLKGLILSLNTIAPKVVLRLGYTSTMARTVAPLDLTTPPVQEPTGPVTSGGPITGGPVTALPPAGLPPVPGAGPLPVLTPTTPVAAAPGLPELGSVPIMLILAGLSLAGVLGLYLQKAGLMLAGGAAGSCTHGLKPGLPDLRKA